MQKQSYWEKQRQKAMQKLADPAWREEQRAKRLQQAQRQQQRAREKAASPEYRQKKIEKAKQYEQRRKDKAVSAPSKKTRTSRGLKGRSLTADERRIQTAIGTLPCIACHIHGQHSPVVSLHHIFGRTAENAHKYVLPLCKWHHQYAAPAEVREQYPWLVPVHADGKIGGKADFIRHNADEMALYQMAIELIN
ncbi:Ref family recombination enhancement nuclease [Escherichia coli]|uniref:Ref family recombination enhancement nuclease n=1 Tax=Escherichia coli TaxID=562 RepID=UPI0004D8FF25|nr:Ref family recombination enhancement nuclease [Escherichia coli]EIL0561794.1 recombinase [Escherichia coli]KEO40015.1 recombination enhancement function protein [Escherichia coli 5-366-08_S4_C1]MCX0107543.1 Ref family protein [Escherichia coli]NNQ22659.1 recombinase [Escherichia coli]NNQ27843.1 recombinase [Escherichia coli]